MNTKKFVAAMLVFTMAFGFTACSGGAKKYAKGLEKIEFTEYDFAEAKKFDEDDDDDVFEDGFYSVITDEKDIKKLLKGADYIDYEDVKTVAVGVQSLEKGDDYSFIYIYIYDFVNKDAAADYFEDTADNLEDRSEEDYVKENDPDFEYEDTYAILVVEEEYYSSTYYDVDAVYLNGKTVIEISSSGSNKPGKNAAGLIDDYCDAMGLQVPGDI